ncbi:MAG: Nif11-like leader peptide family natural product precursor [Gemmataceae bacterium]
MSSQNALQFMNKVSTDEALRAKLGEITARQREAMLAAIIELGAEAGFVFTAQEYQNATKEELERQHAAGKLSEADLRRVAAGATLAEYTVILG